MCVRECIKRETKKEKERERKKEKEEFVVVLLHELSSFVATIMSVFVNAFVR